jgi:L,D-peptidoglycan transpeptidase YkuD (ErfK/YbiS/YcfS/YnhG family)
MKKYLILPALIAVIVLTSFVNEIYADNDLRGLLTNPTANAKQMILVIADNWNSTTGVLQRFQRQSTQSPWQCIGNKITVNLGENGMGWGIGLHGSTLTTRSPEVIEGAEKTPAGVFAITLAFGKDSAQDLGVKLPYKQITNTIFCPDDAKSKFYNSLVDTKIITKDWNSAENMYDYMQHGPYTYGFVVNHNYDKPIPGRGSCFFVHVFSDINAPTYGCTTFAPNLVKDVIVWLDPTQNPVLVQLPKNIYTLFKTRWNLPKN